jgi:hypothetical protein
MHYIYDYDGTDRVVLDTYHSLTAIGPVYPVQVSERLTLPGRSGSDITSSEAHIYRNGSHLSRATYILDDVKLPLTDWTSLNTKLTGTNRGRIQYSPDSDTTTYYGVITGLDGMRVIPGTLYATGTITIRITGAA